MAPLRLSLLLCLALAAGPWRASGQDDFSLEDALDDIPTQKPKPVPKPPKDPGRGVEDFDLTDFFATESPKVIPRRPTKKPDVFIPTKKPRGSTVKPPKKPGPNDFNLEEALDNKNVPNGRGPESFSLEDILDNGNIPNERAKQEKDPIQKAKSPNPSADGEIRMILQTFSHDIKSMQRKLRNMQSLLGRVTQFVETNLSSKKAL